MTDWKDTHSVTCLLCGNLADERETVNITDDVSEIGPSMEVENPNRFNTIMDLVSTHGTGEAHQDCFDEYQEDD